VDLHEIFTKVELGPVSGDFIFEMIRTDLHCHLEITVAQQGHFGINRLQRRNGKRYGRSYYKVLIGSRVCSDRWRHLR